MIKKLLVLGSFALLACNKDIQSSVSDSSLEGIAGGLVITSKSNFQASKSVVLLRSITQGGKFKGHQCTGALIGTRTILTAAHCIEMFLKDAPKGISGFPADRTLEVVFDSNESNVTAKNSRMVSKFLLHPLYQSNVMVYNYTFSDGSPISMTMDRRYDLALLSFEGDVPKGYRPAAVQSEDLDLTGATLSIYGGGARGNAADVTSNASMLASLPGTLTRGEFFIRPGYSDFDDIYLIESTNGVRICGGDSGGPQFLLSAPTPTIVGVNSARVSKDWEQENCGIASVAAKVAPHAAWINEGVQALE